MALVYKAENHNAVLIAHNTSSYDSVFIIKYLFENCKKFTYIPKAKRYLFIKLLDIGSVITDSFNFFQCALAKLPAIFNLNEVKPFFPYSFPTKDNFYYNGPWPAMEFYQPDFMKAKERLEFFKFYETVKNTIFNLRSQLIEYCRSDVNILRQSVILFRQKFLTLTSMDCFANNIFTLSKFCMTFLKTRFITENNIAIIHGNGFFNQQRTSVLASQFLRFYEITYNVVLERHGNRGEKKILNYFVDGYDNKNEVYIDVLGCAWHGHPKCFKGDTIGPTGRPMYQVFHETQIRAKKIMNTHVNYKYFWECDINRNVNFQEFCKTHEYVPKLRPKDAYYGGRVSAFKLQCDISKINKNYKIEYYDFTSLYAYILRNGTIPLGYPDIIINPNNLNIKDYFGLIQADIVVNSSCYIPTIPYRVDKKLYFPICRTCLKNKQCTTCNHSDSEKYLRGTWWSDELIFALEHKQITVLKIHEVWNFKNKGKGYFKAYVDFFSKIKIENSKPPDGVITLEDAKKFCEKYLEDADITLDPLEVLKEVNEGMRTIAKLSHNIIYGKLGMRSDFTQHSLVYNLNDFYDIIYDDRRDIKAILFPHSDFLCIIHWKWKEEFVFSENNTADVNTICALAITSQARIHLHKELLELNKQILYTDTDSVVFLSAPHLPRSPPLGDQIGQFKNENEAGNWIINFLSGGAKNYYFLYAYPLANGDTEKFAKAGITLTHHAKKIITGAEMQRLITNFHCSPKNSEILTVENPNFFYRDEEYKIWCLNQSKKYRIDFDKRRLLKSIKYFDDIPIIDSVPWGYDMKYYSTIV